MPDFLKLNDNPVFKREFPFQGRQLNIDCHKLHYIDEGNGPIILLLHGNPTFSFLYRHIIQKLKSRFRLIALDYPGFGLSEASSGYDYLPQSHSLVLEKFVTALELKELTLFVQDWGGPIGLGFAGRNPHLIKRLIIGNTWAWPVNGDIHFEMFSRIMGGPIGRFFILRKNAFVNLLIPAGTPKSKMTKELLSIYQSAMPKERRIATAIFPREILASRQYLSSVENSLMKLKQIETLLLWGNKDIAFRKKELRRFEQIFPRHQTIILEGAGHYIQEESPEQICQAIISWWNNQ